MDENIRKVIETERIRVSKEIHDRPAQNITAALLNIQLSQSLMAKNPVKAVEMLEQSVEMLKACREYFNYSVYEPATVIKAGLAQQIKNYLEKNNEEVEFSFSKEIDLSPSDELQRWRIIKNILLILMDRVVSVNLTSFNLIIVYSGQKEELKQITEKYSSFIITSSSVENNLTEITVEF